MAASEYHRGEMDITDQTATWDGFIKGSTWGGLIIIMMVGYATLAVAIGLHWIIALGLMAFVGVGSGIVLNLGGRWMATVVMLIGLAFIVQFFIWLFAVMI